MRKAEASGQDGKTSTGTVTAEGVIVIASCVSAFSSLASAEWRRLRQPATPNIPMIGRSGMPDRWLGQ
jgi:hypothetical protein